MMPYRWLPDQSIVRWLASTASGRSEVSGKLGRSDFTGLYRHTIAPVFNQIKDRSVACIELLLLCYDRSVQSKNVIEYYLEVYSILCCVLYLIVLFSKCMTRTSGDDGISAISAILSVCLSVYFRELTTSLKHLDYYVVIERINKIEQYDCSSSRPPILRGN